jgi:hypothetical protein
MSTPTYGQHQRLQDARLVLRALGASPEQIEALAPQVAAAQGPVGNAAGRLLQRCATGAKR